MKGGKRMPKRLVGGVFLLCLTALTLTLSEDGETYINITEPEIIEQLTNLKNYISNPLMIKPVWVQLKNGDEIVVVQGELKIVDTGEFEIIVAINGYKLLIHVEFTQALNSDDEPLDDWYIDTNDAKYLFTSDAQNIANIGDLSIGGDLSVDGDLSVTGDASVGGDLSVTGDVSGDAITGNSIIENMTGYSFAIDVSTGTTKDVLYAGVVKNGNKITFAISIDITKSADTTDMNPLVGQFILPEEIYDKLIPSQVGSYNFLDNRVLQAFSSNTTSVNSTAYVVKSPSNTITFVCGITNFVNDTKYHLRYECTFLLSDNLAPQNP